MESRVESGRADRHPIKRARTGNADKQRKFDRLMAGTRFVNNLTPKFIREFPFNLMLRDVDWRLRTGRPLV